MINPSQFCIVKQVGKNDCHWPQFAALLHHTLHIADITTHTPANRQHCVLWKTVKAKLGRIYPSQFCICPKY